MSGVVVDEHSNFHVHLLICVVLSQLMQNEREDTPLFAASQEGRYDPATLLIQYRADVNYLNKVRLSMVNMVEWCAQFRARWASLHVHAWSS